MDAERTESGGPLRDLWATAPGGRRVLSSYLREWSAPVEDTVFFLQEVERETERRQLAAENSESIRQIRQFHHDWAWSWDFDFVAVPSQRSA